MNTNSDQQKLNTCAKQKSIFDNIEPLRDRTWKNPNLPIWSKVKYGGDKNLPDSSYKIPRSYPMDNFDINDKNEIVIKGTNIVIDDLKIYHPKNIDFYLELKKMQNHLKQKRTGSEIQNMYNWNSWLHKILKPIFKSLFEAYEVPIGKLIRIKKQFYSLYFDSSVILTFFKALYEIPRAIQLDPNLKTYVCTDGSPSYPGGQAMVTATVLEWLSLLFPQEREEFDKLYLDCVHARYLAGVHYEIENYYGGILGRKIGKYFYNLHKDEKDENGNLIDKFENPKKKPQLKLKNREDISIPNCPSNINKRSILYLKKIKARKYERN